MSLVLPGSRRVLSDRATEPVNFWALVREDLRTHEGDWTWGGFRALFAYRVGRARFKAHPLARRFLSIAYRLMHRHIRNHYGIELHCSAIIGRRVKIAHQGGIVIHEHAIIGDDCVIRQGVTIGAVGERTREIAPVLGDRVEIGAGAKLIGKIRIGDDSKIGPNVVLTTSLPKGAIAVVEPPRVVRALIDKEAHA
jgi:serine O-acetyltransferase